MLHLGTPTHNQRRFIELPNEAEDFQSWIKANVKMLQR